MVRISHKQAAAMGIGAGSGGSSGFMARLMDRPKIPWEVKGKKLQLGAEEALCITVADALRAWTLAGRLRGVWFKVANEGKRSWLSLILIRASGLIPGVFDFVFMGAWGCLGIELKAGSNGLEPCQDDFRAWCDAEGVPFRIARSLQKVEEILIENGALAPAETACKDDGQG